MNSINLYKPIENNSTGIRTDRQNTGRAINFTGLNTALTKTIYVSPELIQKMLGIYTREQGRVGNLPNEMINVLKRDVYSSMLIGKKINEVKSALADVADILRKKDKEALKCYSFDQGKMFGGMQNINELGKSNGIVANSSEKFMKNLEVKSSKFLTDSMRKIGLIPQDGSIQVKHLGEGTVGNAYRISFLDGNGKSFFHDKVLKVYKDLDAEIKAQREFQNKILEYIEKMKEDIDKNPDIPDTTKTMIKESLGKISKEHINEIFMPNMKDFYNGPEAEANAALYIKKAIGHSLDNSDLVKPYFFDLKNKIAFTEMADDSLPTITKHIDFKQLGIRHNDLDMNPGNKVAGRIIDYGGIMIDNETLVKNKEARRKFKHSP